MSVGNTKTQGNQGNNFPYQFKTLQLLGKIADNTAGSGADYETRTTSYKAIANGTGYVIDDIIVRYDIIDMPLGAIALTLWFNQTDQTTIAAPPPGDITPIASSASVTVTNAAGVFAVNIQDGGNSITIDSTVLTSIDNKLITDTDDGVVLTDQTLPLNMAVLYAEGDGVNVRLSTDYTPQRRLKVQLDSVPLATNAATETTLAAINAKLVSGTDIGDVTINNAAGASAVNIQDGGNSITVDGSVTVSATDLDIRDLAFATDKIDISGSSNVAVTDGGGSLTVDGSLTVSATDLDIRDLTQNTDAIAIYGSDDGGATKRIIKTDAGGAIQVDLEVASVTVTNTGGASAVNIQDGGNSITVDATDLDIRDLAFATDKVDVTGSSVTANIGTIAGIATSANQTTLGAQTTQLNDGTDTALITAAGELNVLATAQPGVDIGDVTVNNAAGASAVNIQDGGNSITIDDGGSSLTVDGSVTVSATDLDIRDLTSASDSILIYGSDDGGTTKRVIKTDAGGAIQVDLEVASVTVNNTGGASAVNIQDGGNSITIDAVSLPLPTGAATEATLVSIDTDVTNLNTPVIGLAVNMIRASGASSIGAGKRSASFFNAGAANATITGALTLLKPGESVSFSADGLRDVLADIAYDGTGTDLLITTVG